MKRDFLIACIFAAAFFAAAHYLFVSIRVAAVAAVLGAIVVAAFLAGKAVWDAHLLLISADRAVGVLYQEYRSGQKSRPAKRTERHEDLALTTEHTILVQQAPGARYGGGLGQTAMRRTIVPGTDGRYPVLTALPGGGWAREVVASQPVVNVMSIKEASPLVDFKDEGKHLMALNEEDRKKQARRKGHLRLNVALLADLLETSCLAVKARILDEAARAASEKKEAPYIVPAILVLVGLPGPAQKSEGRRSRYEPRRRDPLHEHTGFRTLTIWIASIVFKHPGSALRIKVGESGETLHGKDAMKVLTCLE